MPATYSGMSRSAASGGMAAGAGNLTFILEVRAAPKRKSARATTVSPTYVAALIFVTLRPRRSKLAVKNGSSVTGPTKLMSADRKGGSSPNCSDAAASIKAAVAPP